MAVFLTTLGVSSKIEEIMIEAKKEIFLVSPYLQLSKTFYGRLKDASENKINIKIIFGKDELKPNERNSLADIPKLELFFSENLHAKCYFNENKMVISSMNMYEFSERNNREMGVFIDSEKDSELYDGAKKETLSIIKSSEPVKLNKYERMMPQKEEFQNYISKPKKDYSQGYRGYCIRCSQRIPLDPSRPYCGECFSIWAQYENFQFQENNCHLCGEYINVSMEKPLCYKCFNIYQRNSKTMS